MKASKQYFPVVLFTTLYKVDLLTSESVDEFCGVTIQMKPILQNFCKAQAIC